MSSATKQQVVLVAVDESEESKNALEWAIDHILKPESGFKIIIITVKALPATVLRFTGPGAADVIPLVETDLKKNAEAAILKAKDICAKQLVKNFETQIVEGDARLGLCEAVDKNHADMLIMGSHGYGAFKRAILGSVSDYCAHHAHCSVLIVKKPKAAKQAADH